MNPMALDEFLAIISMDTTVALLTHLPDDVRVFELCKRGVEAFVLVNACNATRSGFEVYVIAKFDPEDSLGEPVQNLLRWLHDAGATESVWCLEMINAPSGSYTFDGFLNLARLSADFSGARSQTSGVSLDLSGCPVLGGLELFYARLDSIRLPTSVCKLYVKEGVGGNVVEVLYKLYADKVFEVLSYKMDGVDCFVQRHVTVMTLVSILFSFCNWGPATRSACADFLELSTQN